MILLLHMLTTCDANLNNTYRVSPTGLAETGGTNDARARARLSPARRAEWPRIARARDDESEWPSGRASRARSRGLT